MYGTAQIQQIQAAILNLERGLKETNRKQLRKPYTPGSAWSQVRQHQCAYEGKLRHMQLERKSVADEKCSIEKMLE